MKASVVVFACVLSAGAVFGCGGSSSSSSSGGGPSGGGSSGGGPSGGPSGGGSSGPVQSQNFGSVYASTFCSSIAGCCTTAGYPADTTSCNSTLRPTIEALTKVYVSNPKIMYDAAAAGACVEAYRIALTACTDEALSKQLNAACDGVFRGTVAPGGACSSTQECAPSPAGSVTCDTGVCGLSDGSISSDVHAKAGEACNATCSGDTNSYGCSGSTTMTIPGAGNCWVEDGLYCGSSSACEVAPKIGQPCGSYTYCEAAAHCDNGSCVADSASGPCSSSDACLAPSYCDLSSPTGSCVPRKVNGAACNSSDECSGGECEQDHCRKWTVANAASCAGLLDN
jgi:hypothetical protein